MEHLKTGRNALPSMLEDIPLDVRIKMCLPHDGAPAHSSRDINDHLNEVFPNKWIGRIGPVR